MFRLVVGVVVGLVVVTVCHVAEGPGHEAEEQEDAHGNDSGYNSWEWEASACAFGKSDYVLHGTPCFFQISLG
jgi:hypothetical protein